MDQLAATRSPYRPVGHLGIAARLLFGWATQPFYAVVTTFIYAPYFATGIARDPTEGQALWGCDERRWTCRCSALAHTGRDCRRQWTAQAVDGGLWCHAGDRLVLVVDRQAA
jgi:hypothetical protein